MNGKPIPLKTEYKYPECPQCHALLSALCEEARVLAEELGAVVVACRVCGSLYEARLPRRGKYWLIVPVSGQGT